MSKVDYTAARLYASELNERYEELSWIFDGLKQSVLAAEDLHSHLLALEDMAFWLNCEVKEMPNVISDDTLITDMILAMAEVDLNYESDELWFLHTLIEECRSYCSDWDDGVGMLIRDDNFVEYAEELADDIGAVPNDLTWPLNHIDWAAAAEDLQQDYVPIEVNGVTYQLLNL